MPTKVMMEALSPTMEEGRLAKWIKNEGDAVKSGDVLAEVETDKAIMELVARGDGVLRKRLLEEGGTAPIGQLIGVIAAADEDIAALVAGAGAGGGAAVAASAATATPAAPSAPAVAPTAPVAVATAAAPPAAAPAAADDNGRTKASPLARRLAAERGVAIGSVQGSGPGGRVIRRDVEAAASAPAAAATAPAVVSVPAPQPTIPAGQDSVDIALTQMRKTIARRLSESIGPIPTFYLTADIDLTQVGALRAQMAALGDSYKVSVNDIVLKAVAMALFKHPEVNAHWLGDKIRQFGRVHLGMAVATDDGLIVPVIFDAHTKGLGQIGSEARALAKKARERKLTPAEYTGSTFSVSNLGMFGIDQFTAIINPPEVGILAIGAAREVPVFVNGAVVPQSRMRVTMSCDHRAIDGAVGAKFLQTLRQYLENPFVMLY
ncbi:MAG: 2-oxo acid dehydrogenase subunit E2 [Gemmatimonadaceae bacterium]|nr:2-oxo acid dehydrogenase subunit E2 [Gemmatimonadaceae bacterium]